MMMIDDSCYDALDFSITQNSPRRRGRYRVDTSGLTLFLDDVAQTFDILDFSSSGCSLHAPAELFTVGRIFNGDLHIGNTSYLANLKLKVIRHITNGSIACAFHALSSQQELMLDKLSLEIQKRSIASHAMWGKREKK